MTVHTCRPNDSHDDIRRILTAVSLIAGEPEDTHPDVGNQLVADVQEIAACPLCSQAVVTQLAYGLADILGAWCYRTDADWPKALDVLCRRIGDWPRP